MLKLFGDEIYATGTVRSNRKHMPTLKADTQMKRGEHDWLTCDIISAIKNGWTTGQWFYCLITIIQMLCKKSIEESRVQKRKWRYLVLLLFVYNTYIGGVDLCDQMKVSYEVDWRSKVRFYLQVFFDFLYISVVNLKIVYDKIQSIAAMSSTDFRFSLARSIIGTFSNRKRATPTSRPSKRSKGVIAMVVDHLRQFAATRARHAYCSLIKLENCTFIRCMKYNIPFCLQKERNCFYEHHIQQ